MNSLALTATLALAFGFASAGSSSAQSASTSLQDLAKQGHCEKVLAQSSSLKSPTGIVEDDYAIGYCLSKDNQVAKATAFLLSVSSKSPDYRYVDANLADCFLKQKDYSSALRYANLAAKKEPNDPDIKFMQAMSYGPLGNKEQSLALFQEAITLSPNQGRYYYGRAMLHFFNKEYRESCSDFQQSRRLGYANVSPPSDPCAQATPQEDSPAPLSTAHDQTEQGLKVARLQAELERAQQLYGKGPRKKFILASTQEPEYVSYMRAYVARIERIGTINYSSEARRRKLSGAVVVSVEIRRDGSVAGVTILGSSGIPIPDQAAEQTVRLAQPFPELPHTKYDPDLLVITRTFHFVPGRAIVEQ